MLKKCFLISPTPTCTTENAVTRLQQYIKAGTRNVWWNGGDGLVPEKFAKVSDKIKRRPGDAYCVKIYGISKELIRHHIEISTEEILDFLSTKSAYLLGMQGLIALWDVAADLLPRNRSLVSLDRKENCWRNEEGEVKLPYLMHSVYNEGTKKESFTTKFGLRSFDQKFSSDSMFVSFED